MAGRLLVGALVGATAAGLVVADGARLAQPLLAPAHDAVTTSTLRSLATALGSWSVAGEEAAPTEAELAAWGWAPSGTTAVTVWVTDDGFRAVARDVRPGSATFEVSSDGGLRVQRLAGPGVPDGAAAGLTVVTDG